VARHVVLENLLSAEPEQRANALEVLDAATDRALTRPLLEVWDEAAPPIDRASAVRSALGDPEAWVRACALLAAARSGLGAPDALVGADDPDPLVRETARLAAMETLPTVPLLERVVFLRRVPLFAELAPVDVKHVAEVASEQAYGDGISICEQGDAGEELYVVVSGAIRVVRDGDEVARRGPGEYVGEMAVITGGARMASLVADGEVRVLVVDRRRFERILRERPDASLAVMRTLCERLEETHAGSSAG
jgi:CRP/FNR family cyclic AMP-dependent transcriptional regulator